MTKTTATKKKTARSKAAPAAKKGKAGKSTKAAKTVKATKVEKTRPEKVAKVEKKAKTRAVREPKSAPVAVAVAAPVPQKAMPQKPKAPPAAKPASEFGSGLGAGSASGTTATRTASPAAATLPSAPASAVAEDAAGGGEVETFLRDCDHPRKADFEQVRKLILEASPSIAEGIKWNAPSFRTSEWFATFHLREPQKVLVVFHLGAKKRDTSTRLPVGAPEGMVEWLSPDRCMVTVDDVKRRGKALQAFVRAWILHV